MKKLLYGWLFAWTAIWFASASYASVDEYRLGTGDVLRIAVYSQPDLTTETRLDERGEIIFPLLGAVKLGGMTPGAAGREISKRLRSGGFLVDPHVNLNVVQYRSQQVSVLGRVNRPGQFALEKPGRVSDVLALAGGVMPDAAEVITLIRANDGKAQFTEIDMLALFKPGGEKLNVVVADGDIINVQRQPVFYIYGEVQRPGSFRLERNMTVVQALSQGGGLNQRGTQRGIKILRRTGNGVLNEASAELGDPVMPDDVIYVKESLF